MKLVIARHCRSVWNELRRMQGRHDIPLSAGGLVQAEALAKSLAGLGISRVVSSDLARAAETARIVGQALGVPVETDERLREISYGSLEGHTLDECRQLTDPHNHEDSYDIMGFDYRQYGGESALQAYARQRAVLEDIRSKHGTETVMVIGHGHSLRTVLYGIGAGIAIPKQGEYRVIEF